jgi:hypothetical protein
LFFVISPGQSPCELFSTLGIRRLSVVLLTFHILIFFLQNAQPNGPKLDIVICSFRFVQAMTLVDFEKKCDFL